MVNRDAFRVNKNVTHRMFTHRLSTAKIGRDGPRHPHPFWPCNPSRTRGAEDQSGRGSGEVRVASHVLQRCRARDQERLPREYRKNCQGSEEEPARTVRQGLGVCPRFSIRESRGGSFVINAVNGTTDLGWEPLPRKLWHRKVASVGRFRNPFHQERACYP